MEIDLEAIRREFEQLTAPEGEDDEEPRRRRRRPTLKWSVKTSQKYMARCHIDVTDGKVDIYLNPKRIRTQAQLEVSLALCRDILVN